MKKGTASFSKEFVNPISGLKEWVRVEMEFDMSSGETATGTLDKCKQEVCGFQMASNVLNEIELGLPSRDGSYPVIQKESEDIRIGLSVDDIMSCGSVTVLGVYKKIIDKLGRDDLRAAHSIRYEELTRLHNK